MKRIPDYFHHINPKPESHYPNRFAIRNPKEGNRREDARITCGRMGEMMTIICLQLIKSCFDF